MTQTPAHKFIAAIVIVAAPFAMGAFFLSWGPSHQYELSNPSVDGYVQPRDIALTVAKTQRSTVTVYCEIPDNESLGSAWAVTLDEDAYKKYDSVFITNHHVVDDCIGKEKYLKIARLYSKMVPAKIITLDKKNDLAVIVADIRIPTLKLSENIPYPGYWTMVSGSADGYEGSIAFGSVLNMNDKEVLITANASHGNSGGPVIDNEGRVIGTLTSGSKKEQYNVATSLDAMCAKILSCDGKYFWSE